MATKPAWQVHLPFKFYNRYRLVTTLTLTHIRTYNILHIVYTHHFVRWSRACNKIRWEGSWRYKNLPLKQPPLQRTKTIRLHQLPLSSFTTTILQTIWFMRKLSTPLALLLRLDSQQTFLRVGFVKTVAFHRENCVKQMLLLTYVWSSIHVILEDVTSTEKEPSSASQNGNSQSHSRLPYTCLDVT